MKRLLLVAPLIKKTVMAKLTWTDPSGKKWTSGVDRGVLFVANPDGTYQIGVPWNGLVSVKETFSGGDVKKKYADNRVYVFLTSPVNFSGSIQSFAAPPAFDKCIGVETLLGGMKISQQSKITFGFAYRSLVFNGAKNKPIGKKIHIVYCATVNRTERKRTSINSKVDDLTCTWTFTTLPQAVTINGVTYKATAYLELDSTQMTEDEFTTAEHILYGDDFVDSHLPSIEQWYNELTILYYILIPNEYGETCHFLRPYFTYDNACGETARIRLGGD